MLRNAAPKARSGSGVVFQQFASTLTATMNFSTTLRSDIVRGGVAYKF
jgi:hypothetical protein